MEKIDGGITFYAAFDGACEPNPGPCSWGVVRLNENGRVIDRRHGYLGKGTNNIAEYEGLIAALKWAHELGSARVVLRSDSTLVVNGARAAWSTLQRGQRLTKAAPRKRKQHIRDLMIRAYDQMKGLDSFEISWVPRERNMEADRESSRPIRPW